MLYEFTYRGMFHDSYCKLVCLVITSQLNKHKFNFKKTKNSNHGGDFGICQRHPGAEVIPVARG